MAALPVRLKNSTPPPTLPPMAMSDASSNMAQWARLYHHGPGQANGCPAESTVVTAAAATATASSPTSAGSPTRAPPGIEGRVGKPARRRSRASRRAPVTLLNTDTSNFRAMVQQFTGIPSGQYPAGPSGPVINFAADYGMPLRPSPASVMSFDHLQQRPLQEHLFRPPQHQHPYNDVGYAMHGAAAASTSASAGHSDMFVHGFESADERLLLQSMHAAQMLPRPASTNNTNGYNFG